ncbi:MAG: adenylate/guanylate cyclase domain-containing protein [Rhizobiaceae bacterium]
MNSKFTYMIVILGLLLAAVAVRVWDPAPVARMRLLIFDIYQRLAPREYSPDLPVRIVEIDDTSINAIGQWPWPRNVFVQMIENLHAKGAAVVAFDLVLPEPERNLAQETIARLPDSPAARTVLEQLKALPTNDQLLADAVSKQMTVLGVMGVSHATATKPEPDAAFVYAGDDPKLFLPTYEGILASIPVLQSAAVGSGSLNWVPDFDQIVRRIPLVITMGTSLFPSLSVEVLRVVQQASTVVIRSSNSAHDEAFGEQTGVSRILVGEIEVPTDASGQIWLRYTPHDKRRFISAKRVIDNAIEEDDVAGRVILIGATASGLLDLRATPLDAAIPGVEIHAQAIEQMLLGIELRRVDYSTGIELVVIILGGILLAWLSYATGAALGAIAGAITTFAVVSGAFVAFLKYGFLIDPSFPVVVLTAVYIVSTVIVYFLTERERNQVRSAFGHYMAPALIEQLVREPERLSLGGEDRELTMLFSDVRNFTSISEAFKSDPPGLTKLMNRILSPLSNAIIQRNGVIDKYIGDAIMAFWNAPIDDPDHPKNACRAALEMLQSLEELNQNLQSADTGETIGPIRVGIGVNTGRAVVGNMGSDMRFDYSVLGDSVNLASRLEGQSKLYGLPIILGEATAKTVMDELATLEVDRLRVKGKEQAETIFALVGDENLLADENFQELQRLNDSMLSSYRSQDWETATAALEAIKDLPISATIDLDTYLFLYETRILEYQANPPGQDWDGVYLAISK